jgi:hypothetical protein
LAEVNRCLSLLIIYLNKWTSVPKYPAYNENLKKEFIAVVGVKKYRGGNLGTILPGTMLGKIIRKLSSDYKREYYPGLFKHST